MNICKRALGIALRHPLYLVIYIGFLSAMGVALMGEASDGASDPQEPSVRTRIALVDRDKSEVSEALERAIAASDELVGVPDDSTALQDALATNRADVVLIVPDGFGDDLISAARGPRTPRAAGRLRRRHASRCARDTARRAACLAHSSRGGARTEPR